MKVLQSLILLSTYLPSRAARNARCHHRIQMISNKATLGAGCYWGTEKFLIKDFNEKFPGSIVGGAVGFMGGAKKYPTYREVCSGRTGHVEVYDMEYDGRESTFENILRFFFSFHDPTTVDRQGNDRGSQYASVIFAHDESQKGIAAKVIEDVQRQMDQGRISYAGKKIVTTVRDAEPFYEAMPEHQRYLEMNPGGYCNHYFRYEI